MHDDARAQLIRRCNVILGTLLDLGSQVKQAHWNIKGPQFFARHQLFDTLATHLRDWSDSVAERASTLGGYAEGTMRLAVVSSVLPEYDVDAVDGRQHLAALIQRYGRVDGVLRETIAEARRFEDPVSEDLFIEILRGIELDVWFLDSHLNN